MDVATRDRQVALEADAVQSGIERYRKRLQQTGLVGRRSSWDFMREALPMLADYIRSEQDAIRHKDQFARRLPGYAVLLLSLEAERLGVIALFQILLAFRGDEEAPTVTTVAKSIGERCRLERAYDCRRGRGIDVADLLRERNVRASNARARATRMAARLDSEDLEPKDCIRLGALLIAIVADSTGLIAKELVERGPKIDDTYKRIAVVRLTEIARQRLSEAERHYEALAAPVALPMLLEPGRWTALYGGGGGYLTNDGVRFPRVDLVKHNGNAAIIAAIRSAPEQSGVTIAAVNSLQNTRWRLNTFMVRALREARERGMSAKLLFNRHRARDLDWALLDMRLRSCDRLLDEAPDGPLFYPWTLDFRGRMYASAQLFNPQSDDVGRAVIEFAEGKPVGDDGRRWLAINVANLFGHDKRPFEERERWVHDNDGLIRSFVANPFDEAHPFWEQADKPWRLLAACREWLEYRSLAEDARAAFRSHTPIWLDGTCNGYQHLSAMALDRDGAAATNLLKTDTPQDIYLEVASTLCDRLRRSARRAALEPRAWLGAIERGALNPRRLVKNGTMTQPYGSSARTVADQLIKDGFTSVVARGDGKADHDRLAQYLARQIRVSIRDRIRAPLDVMEWLQDLATACCRENVGINWVSSAGFPVVLERRYAADEVKTRVGKLILRKWSPEAKLDWKAQKNGIAPDFVHSYDAAHLMRVVVCLSERGVTDLAVVHDSYGVHACHVETLRKVLRQEFVAIYRDNPLELLAQSISRRHPTVRVRRPPIVMSLDVNEVHQANYMFA